MTDILIIEDDPEMGELVRDFMINEGFSVKLCADAETALVLLEGEECRLVLLDVMLPKMNGFETCSAIRSIRNIPILIMSALTDEESKLLGYETGADDYIDKPFSIRVLTAKIRALMKRNSHESESRGVLCSCGVELDTVSRRVTAGGKELKLNAKEFELLQYLMQHEGEAVSKDELFNAVWGYDCFTEPSTVSVHIRWLREKIEKDPNSPEIIKTVWKVGYRFGESR
ncbi:response regulator transcription factor [Ruminococcus flavefaciens]|uniref:Stage 0 sporulation protein A homolog n=1 Tax=Ruminococcus flavefaciens TaxID=1265 RepID=A0A1M7MPZ7_RUMFL|nr:response regulator transcription factor [Ruminococcus flavefaciens]SHM93096.1 DNA-binding response regulator, OmpR family, contains REC and winged-helix (wHTH) domain [Ruminococcus flavefaciens]